MFLKEQPERDLALDGEHLHVNMQIAVCVYNMENKTSNEIRPDPFISAIRPSFKRMLDQIPQEQTWTNITAALQWKITTVVS